MIISGCQVMEMGQEREAGEAGGAGQQQLACMINTRINYLSVTPLPICLFLPCCVLRLVFDKSRLCNPITTVPEDLRDHCSCQADQRVASSLLRSLSTGHVEKEDKEETAPSICEDFVLTLEGFTPQLFTLL